MLLGKKGSYCAKQIIGLPTRWDYTKKSYLGTASNFMALDLRTKFEETKLIGYIYYSIFIAGHQ